MDEVNTADSKIVNCVEVGNNGYETRGMSNGGIFSLFVSTGPVEICQEKPPVAQMKPITILKHSPRSFNPNPLGGDPMIQPRCSSVDYPFSCLV